jgi:hypothetical protein
MPGIDEIDWSKISLPQDVSPGSIIRDYENAIDELVRLNKEYDRLFTNKMKRARLNMMTDNIFRTIDRCVIYDQQSGLIDVQMLLMYIANDDRQLFSDIANFIYPLFHEKLMNDTKMKRFKALLTYYLCKSGF